MTELALDPHLSVDVPEPEVTQRARIHTLYAEHGSYVFHSLRRLGVRSFEVEDVMHEVFMIAHRRIESYNQEVPVRAWLFGIAYRKAADFRKQARHRHETCEEHEEAIDLGASPEEQIGQQQQRQLVLAALEKIELSRRAVFVMHDIDETPVPIIAEQLAIPLNTAYSRLRLARAEFSDAVHRLRSRGRA